MVDSADKGEASSNHVSALLTAARFGPYLRESDQDESKALELYAWNISISAAFMEVIAYFEVILRNAVDRELTTLADESHRKIPWFMVPTVTGAFHPNVEKAIEATRGRLRGVHPRRDSRDQIVAGMSFGFWTQFFTSEDLWRDGLSRVFPGAPRSRRKNVTSKLERMRAFRNRLAHHDSMLSQDIMLQLEETLTLIEWIDPSARVWVTGQERVTEVYKQRPVTPINTLVVPATQAWDLYLQESAYACPPGRTFRPFEYIAFYADKEIKPRIAQLRDHRDNVEWTDAESARPLALQGDENRLNRKIGKVIAASRALGWTAGRYQVFILSSATDPVATINLPAGIPHKANGRGSAFVQRHRYVSHHRLRSAQSTADLI